eukprot:4611891-Pyramimonas_sp.AAC.1
MLETVPINRISRNLLIDASPQRRGLELHASSVDIWAGDRFIRKVMPCASLGKAFIDRAGKTIATLWQMFLAFGPSIEPLQLACMRVRSITTDQGAERLIPNMVGMIGDFYERLDRKFNRQNWDEHEFLFP